MKTEESGGQHSNSEQRQQQQEQLLTPSQLRRLIRSCKVKGTEGGLSSTTGYWPESSKKLPTLLEERLQELSLPSPELPPPLPPPTRAQARAENIPPLVISKLQRLHAIVIVNNKL